MPSLLDIRRRVRAVKSTQQITKAMKMVAASKLRRAQERIQQARPYASQMLRVLNSLASRVDPSAHPLLDERQAPRAGGRALLFVDHRRPRPVRQLQHQRHQVVGDLHHRESRSSGRARPGRPARPGLFRAPRVRRALRAGQPFRGAEVRRREGDGQDGDRGVRQGRGRQRLSRLQRVQVGHAAARRRRAAAADSAAGVQRRDAGRKTPIVDYLYEPAPDELFEHLIPTTSRSRSTGRSSNRRPRSTRRG